MLCQLYRQQAEENRYYLREWSPNASGRLMMNCQDRTKLMEQRQEVTANWESAKLARRSYLREVHGDNQCWPAVVVEVVFERLEHADASKTEV